MRRPLMFGRRASGESLPWSWAQQRLIEAGNYWVAVCLADGWPHVRPVWGVWFDVVFWYSTSSRAVRVVGDGPQATVHLESGDQVVIIEGRAALIEALEVRRRFVEAYNAKYRWQLRTRERGVGDDDGAAGEVIAIRPVRVYCWTTSDLQTATCWEFDPGSSRSPGLTTGRGPVR